MTQKVDGLSAIKKESAEDREKYASGWDRIFNNKKKPSKKKVSKK